MALTTYEEIINNFSTPTLVLAGPATDKIHFLETYKWCLAGCVIGAGIVWVFGPMLIVFGMFAIGTLSVVLHEAARIKKEA